jgi:hypothetical protein
LWHLTESRRHVKKHSLPHKVRAQPPINAPHKCTINAQQRLKRARYRVAAPQIRHAFCFFGAKTLAALKPDTKQVRRLVLFGIKTRWNNSNKAPMRSSS